MATRPTKKFECMNCYDEIEAVPYRVNPSDADVYEICRECAIERVVPAFKDACKTETAWPAAWGGVEIDETDFLDLISEELRKEKSQKRREYNTAPMLRVYCPSILQEGPETCHTFLGTRVTDASDPETSIFTCPNCQTKVCGICCQLYAEDGADGNAHMCSDAQDAYKTIEESKDYVRGRHFQICPNIDCLTRVELLDGCNHIICQRITCKTNFCFICGERATEHSGHWNARADGTKGCPRWNHPDDDNALFDRAGDADSDIIDDDVENGNFPAEVDPNGIWPLPARVRRIGNPRFDEGDNNFGEHFQYRLNRWYAARLIVYEYEEEYYSAEAKDPNAPAWAVALVHICDALNGIEGAPSPLDPRLTPEEVQQLHDFLLADYTDFVPYLSVEMPERFWDTHQALEGACDYYHHQVREFVGILRARLGLDAGLLPIPPPFRGQGITDAYKRRDNNDREFYNTLYDNFKIGPHTERIGNILDLAYICTLPCGGYVEYPETLGNDNLDGSSLGGPVGEILMDLEHAWLIAHHLRTIIPNDHLGPSGARFDALYARYLNRAPKRFNAHRRFLRLPHFDPAAPLTVTIFDKTVRQLREECPVVPPEIRAKLDHVVLTTCHKSRVSHEYTTQLKHDRFNLLACIDSNMPLRGYKPMCWWMGRKNTTLERFRFKHEIFLEICARLPAGFYDDLGNADNPSNEHVREIVDCYKTWASKVIEAMGEGRKVPITEPEAVRWLMGDRPEGNDFHHWYDLDAVNGDDTIRWRFL